MRRIALVLALVIVGCNHPPTPLPPVATATPTPVETATPGITPTLVATLVPTATASPTAVPTSTPTPILTPTLTPTSTPATSQPTPCVPQPGPGGGGCPTPVPTPGFWPTVTSTVPATVATPVPPPTPCVSQPGPGGGGCPPSVIVVVPPAPTPVPTVTVVPVVTPASGVTYAFQPAVAGACALASAPVSFSPYPADATQPYADNATVSTFYAYQSVSGPRLFSSLRFGYQILDLADRLHPRPIGLDDLRMDSPGVTCAGDCHGSIAATGVSADGARVIFGLAALASGAQQTRVGQPSSGWGFTLAGDMAPKVPGGVLVQRVGSGYYAYTFADDGVQVADVTTLPGIDPDVTNNLRSTPAPSLPGGYSPTLSGYWITYTNGPNIYVVNASTPFPATAFTAQTITKTDFGRATDQLVSFSAAQDPANPAAVYILGEFSLGSSGQHAGWTLVRLLAGVPSVIGSLRPAVGATATYVNALASPNASGLFAFMWTRTSAGFRQYSSSVAAFGTVSGFFDVTAAGFSGGRSAYVAGTAPGQIYAYSPGGSQGWVVPMMCGAR